jgi:hypothetical protein
MPRGLAGNAIVATMDGALNIKLTRWSVEDRYAIVRDTAAGDVAEARLASFEDWEADLEGYIVNAAERGVISPNETKRGTVIALALKERVTDTAPVFSASGLADRLRYEADALSDTPITARVHVICSEGVVPVWDTTPG